MPFIAMTAGIMTGLFLAIQFSSPFLEAQRIRVPSTRVFGTVTEVSDSSLTFKTESGKLVRATVSPTALWHAIEYKTIASSTIRGIPQTVEREAFTPGTRARITISTEGPILASRVVKIEQ